MSCSAFPITKSSGSAALLHCDIRASLRDCWAQLLLRVCDAGFQGTAHCVLTWRLRRCHSCAECQIRFCGNVIFV